jgi:hypothetical protein
MKDESDEERFNVYLYIGQQHLCEEVRHRVDMYEAVRAAELHANRTVAAKMGIVQRIIITDESDHTVFEWIKGKGVTYPTDEMMAEYRAKKLPVPSMRQ